MDSVKRASIIATMLQPNGGRIPAVKGAEPKWLNISSTVPSKSKAMEPPPSANLNKYPFCG